MQQIGCFTASALFCITLKLHASDALHKFLYVQMKLLALK